MGAVSDVVERLRGAFRSDKERGGELLAKGALSPVYPDSGYDLLQAYGYDALSDYLRLEHDLLSRYVDFEEMDDYPTIACISRENRVFVASVPRDVTSISSSTEVDVGLCEISSRTVGDLALDAEQGKLDDLYVLAFDHVEGRVKAAKAIGPKKTGSQVDVYRVTYEDYRKTRTWSVVATGDHLFMLRDGSYRPAIALEEGDRLMPCTLHMSKAGYLQVYEPLKQSPKGDTVYQNVHRLVAEAVHGPLPRGSVVHHEDHNKANARPSNLRLVSRSEHVREHEKDPEYARRRAEKSASTVRSNWEDPEYKLRLAKSHETEGRAWLDAERANPQYKARGLLSDAHRAAISKGRTIDLAPDVVEAAVRAHASVNDAARSLGVSWNTLVRRMAQFGIPKSALGSNMGGPKLGEVAYGNHRVVSVEYVGREDVYDIEVPKYRNFAVGVASESWADGGAVFVHNSALDIYADDASQPDTSIKRSVWVTSSDQTLQTNLDDLFHKQLRMDEEIWEITRSLCKYGSDFEEMLINENGVVGLNFLPAPTVRRIEGPRGELHGFVQDFKGRTGYSPQEFQQMLSRRSTAIRSIATGGAAAGNMDKVAAFEPWECVHFRLRGKSRRSVYGSSVLEGSRWIWKRLLLLEDAAMIFRLQRAPERFAFYVDVGDLPPAEALAFVNKVRQQHKKKKFVNPSSGRMDMKFEPLSPDDDFYVPVRKGVEGTRIEVLGGPAWQSVDDILYFENKMFAALKVPKAYMAQDESSGRAVLSSQDVRFARTTLRVQRELRNGLKKVARTHLAAIKIDPAKVDFEINMTVPSAIFELAQLEVRNARADLASRMREQVSLHWILRNVYQMSDSDIEIVIAERTEDMRRDGATQAEVEKMSALAQAAGQREDVVGDGGMQRLTKRLNALPAAARKPINEKELFRGNRESEKRAADKLDRLLTQNASLAQEVKQVGGLLRDLASTARK